MTIIEACKRYGISRTTLQYRVLRNGLKPIGQCVPPQYSEAELMHLAYLPKHVLPTRERKGKPYERNGKYSCVRCGHNDYGNEVRQGLCFECFCHEYCANRRI